MAPVATEFERIIHTGTHSLEPVFARLPLLPPRILAIALLSVQHANGLAARERKRNEALADKIFSKGRRQSAPAGLKASQPGGSLASRVGVKKVRR
jgi:hypothetical protein